MNRKTVVLLSGGIDSSTLLYYLHSGGSELYPLAINYGQRHVKELEAAKAIAASLGLKLPVADISSNLFLFAGSALTDDIEVPKQSYDKESMSVTVVPNRNMIFLSLATAYAVSVGAEVVSYAAHSGDHHLYPDCRPEFIKSIGTSIRWATKIKLSTPFALLTKADIVKEGLKLKVPFELTWSCYEGKDKACGKCGTCAERLEAFKINNTVDLLKYEKG